MSSPSPSAFSDTLYALGASLIAVLVVEAYISIGRPFGTAIINPVSSGSINKIHWLAYPFFFSLALFLPLAGSWLRHSKRVIATFGPAPTDAFDYVMREALPTSAREQGVWVTVQTENDESLLGQLLWRTTAPDPLELVLARVRDVNDSTEEEQDADWVVWIPRESIKAVWVNILDENESDTA
jgi:hypothetical protein